MNFIAEAKLKLSDIEACKCNKKFSLNVERSEVLVAVLSLLNVTVNKTKSFHLLRGNLYRTTRIRLVCSLYKKETEMLMNKDKGKQLRLSRENVLSNFVKCKAEATMQSLHER